MSRPSKRLPRHVRIRQTSARQTPVVRAYTGRDGRIGSVDGDGVGGAVGVGVVGHHLRQFELGGEGGGYGGAEVAGGDVDHESGFGGGEVLGGDDEVAFVLAGRGVHYEDEVAFCCRTL